MAYVISYAEICQIIWTLGDHGILIKESELKWCIEKNVEQSRARDDKAPIFSISLNDLKQNFIKYFDETGGCLITPKELKAWIEFYVNQDIQRRYLKTNDLA